MKKILSKYGHGLFALYLFIYLPWFFYLEGKTDVAYHEIHIFLDDIIPFWYGFIIPYIIWFFYVVVSFIFLFFKEEQGKFIQFGILLTGGMTIAMMICTFYPNCVNLRPETIHADNFLANIVNGLYTIDTSTNVFPSVHAYNSIVVCVALERNAYFKKHNKFRFLNILLCVLICLSTVFLKQHSVLDVLGAIALYIILGLIVYLPKWKIFDRKNIVIHD